MLCRMTMQSFWNTACGVRSAFAVTLLFTVTGTCFSSSAEAGFFTVESEAHGLHETSQGIDCFSVFDVNAYSDEHGASGLEPFTASNNRPDQPREYPERAPQETIPAGLLAPGGDSQSSGGSGNSRPGRSISSVPMLAAICCPSGGLFVSRLVAGETAHLPLRLPFKLFRPPRDA